MSQLPFSSGKINLAQPGIPDLQRPDVQDTSIIPDAIQRAGETLTRAAIDKERRERALQERLDAEQRRLDLKGFDVAAEEIEARAVQMEAEGMSREEIDSAIEAELELLEDRMNQWGDDNPDYTQQIDLGIRSFRASFQSNKSQRQIKDMEIQAETQYRTDVASFKPTIMSNDDMTLNLDVVIADVSVLREQINSSDALSPATKVQLIRELETNAATSVVREVSTYPGQDDPENLQSQLGSLFTDENAKSVFNSQLASLRDNFQQRQQDVALQGYTAARYDLQQGFMSSDSPSIVNLFNGMRQASDTNMYRAFDLEDESKYVISQARNWITSRDFAQTISSGTPLRAEDILALQTLKQEATLFSDAIGSTESVRELQREVDRLINESNKIVTYSSEADQKFFETGRYDRNTPEQVLAAAAMTQRDIETGAWREKSARGFEMFGTIEPEFEQHVVKLAKNGNVQELVNMFELFKSDELRSKFALQYPLDDQQGLVIAMAATLPASEAIEIVGNERIMSNMMTIAQRHLGQIGPQEVAESEAFKKAGDRPTFAEIEAQRYDTNVPGTAGFVDIEGEEIGALSAGVFAQIEPEHSLFLFSHMAKIVDEVGPEAAYGVAFDVANQRIQDRYVFMKNSDGRFVAVMTSRSKTGLTDKSLRGFAKETMAAAKADGNQGTPDFDGLMLITDRQGERYVATPMIDQNTGLTTHIAIQPYGDFGQTPGGETRYDTPNWITRASLWIQGRLSEEKKNWTRDKDDEKVVGVALMTMAEFKANYPTSAKTGDNEFRDPEQVFTIDTSFNVKSDLPNIGTMTLNPRLLWNESLYKSNDFKGLTGAAQARIRAMARETARIDYPDVDSVALSFLTEQYIINHGWKVK